MRMCERYTLLIPLAENHSFEKRMSKNRSTADLRSSAQCSVYQSTESSHKIWLTKMNPD